MKHCIKCNIEKPMTDYYKNGKVCIPCQKAKNYDYSTKPRFEGKYRKCLMCDKSFVSFGNRRCDQCNLSSEHDESVSSYLSVG